MVRRPPRSTRTYTLFPSTTRCRSRQGWARRVGGEPARAAQDDGGQIVEKGTRCRRTCESHFRNCVINLEESTGAPSITMAGACCIRSWFIFNVLVIIALWCRLELGLYWFRVTSVLGRRMIIIYPYLP